MSIVRLSSCSCISGWLGDACCLSLAHLVVFDADKQRVVDTSLCNVVLGHCPFHAVICIFIHLILFDLKFSFFARYRNLDVVEGCFQILR